MMRFLAIARVDLLAEREWTGFQWVRSGQAYTRDEMSRYLAGFSNGADLSRWLRGKLWTRDKLLEFEQDLIVFALEHRGAPITEVHGFGWLTSYWQELGTPGWTPRTVRERHRQDLPEFHQLARWHSELAKSGPNNSAEALVLGQALLGLLAGATNPDAAAVMLQDRSGDLRPAVDRTLRALVMVSCRRPTGGALPAIQMAALFGHHVVPIVEEHLRHSPVGFRSMKVLTRILEICHRTVPPWWSPGGAIERDITWKAIKTVAREDLPDPYPARSFLVEAFNEVIEHDHKGFPRDMIDTAQELLVERLSNSARPIRERLFAAVVLHRHDPDAARYVIELQRSHPAFDYLERLFAYRERVGGDLDEILLASEVPSELPELNLVENALRSAIRVSDVTYLESLPVTIQDATVRYLRYALTSPNGSRRRRAGELLREAGVTFEVSQMVAKGILEDRQVTAQQPWIRELAAFLLGNIRAQEQTDVLFDLAAEHASADEIAVAHAALFAIGDAGHREPDLLDNLIGIAQNRDTPTELRRAAAYSLATLRPENHLEQPPIDQQLKTLEDLCATDPDPLTQVLGCWGAENIKRWMSYTEAGEQIEVWGLTKLAPDLPGCI